jgi:5-methylcytosine-specific restriction protein A
MSGPIKKPCANIGCPNLTTTKYCIEHEYLVKREQQHYDKQRGSAHSRGYTKEWWERSRAFLRKPGNEFCKLRLEGCFGLSQCTDHIIPVDGPDDPNFWNEDNWQASCNHCNRAKGKRRLDGTG